MISRTALHAVRALAVLAELAPGAYLGAAAIARKTAAPRNYLGKLLQTMAREGLVVSQKGSGGGFRLAKDTSRISLYDVVDPIDHVDRWSGCFLGRARCRDESPCAVHSSWQALRDAYLKLLKETKIAELVEAPELLSK